MPAPPHPYTGAARLERVPLSENGDRGEKRGQICFFDAGEKIDLSLFSPLMPGPLSHRLIHLIAHRGNARDFPENTLPALQSAVELGIRFIEFDVQLSADGVPVVIVRGYDIQIKEEGSVQELLRPEAEDLLR